MENVKFNVIIVDFNTNKPKPYDIIPYLKRCYKEWADKPKTFDEFKKLILEEGRYQWFSRCEYEIQITGFPCDNKLYKIDVYDQVLMNIDLITELLMKSIKE